MALSSEEISLAYRLVLNRQPSEAEIAHMSAHYRDVAGLRTMLLISDEFVAKYAALQRERAAQRRPALVHVHVPKTGGTTLAEALSHETHLMPNAVYHDHMLGELAALPSVRRNALRYIRGHLNMGAGEALGASYRNLVVIRRAGPRIHSFFRFIRRNAGHPSHQEVSRLGFGDYLEYSLDHPAHRIEIDNGQLRRLAGKLGEQRFDRPDGYLRQALFNVLQPGTIFGFTEHMDALLRQLHDEGFLSSATIDNHNVAPAGAPFEAVLEGLSADQRQLFDDFTAWDDYFYDLCMALMPPAP